MIIGTSMPSTACSAREPMPGSAKMVSVKTTPPSSAAVSIPTTVSSGISALRSACLNRTDVSDSPFALAARM